jgi:osmotically-inducible protein OsmY
VTVVKTKIERAFERHAAIDAQRVRVVGSDGTITLTGAVSSLSERDDAEPPRGPHRA